MKKSIMLIAMDDYECIYEYFQYLILSIAECVDNIVLIGDKNTLTNNYIIKNNVHFFHANETFDVEKWRKYVVLHPEEIENYDELYVMNSSVFGPVYSLQDIIKKMRRKKYDFWGITKHAAIYSGKNQICEPFLQRYFMCFTRPVFQELQSFFITMPKIQSYEMADKEFEFPLSAHLEKSGYKCGVYCDTNFLNGQDNQFAVSHILVNLDILLEKYHMPFIPKVNFQMERKMELEYREGMQNSKVLNWLKTHTNYKTKMIYEYLVYNCNVYDNLINLNLYFTLPFNSEGKIINNNFETLCIAYLYYEDQMDSRLHYLNEMCQVADVLIVTDSISKMILLRRKVHFKCHIIVTPKRGREWAALLITCHEYIQKYKYLCFLHDKKTEYLAYISLGRSFQDLLWENMACSKTYVENIINLFEQNPQIGLLLPPIFNMGIYNDLYGDYWSVCFDETIALANNVGINTSLISRKKPPISIGSCFWCKIEALQSLWDYPFSFEDFPKEPLPIDGTINHALERILPYIAQNHGFFSAIIMNEEFGKLYHSNQEYMLQSILKILHNKKGYLGTFNQMICWLENMNIRKPNEGDIK